MDPFLDLNKQLDLAPLEMRSIVVGRASIIDRMKAIGPNGKVEASHVAEFDGLAKRCEEIDAHIVERKAIERRSTALSNLQSNVPPQPQIVRGPESRQVPDVVTNPEATGHEYSLFRAVDRVSRNLPLDGFEGEVSREIELRSNKAPTSFYMPWNLQVRNLSGRQEYRAFNASAGAGLIPTIQGPGIIDILRARMVMAAMGAVVLTDMVGEFNLPKKTAGSAAYWVAEATAPTASSPTVGQVDFSPSTVGTYVDITRKLMKQSSRDAEALLRMDIVEAIQVEMDRVGLNGSGSGAEPEGILQNSSVPTVAIGTNGGAMTWAKVVEMETAVAVANADVGNMGYVMSPEARGHFKSTPKVANQALFLWDGNEVNGYRAMATKSVPVGLDKGSADGTCTAAVFGNFADAVYALWGAIDVIVDTSSLSTSGGTRLVLLADADFQLRRAESFSACLDIIHGYSAS